MIAQFPLGMLPMAPPRDWTVTTVGAICDQTGGEVQTGPFGSQLHASDYSETGTPVIMPQDLIDGVVDTTHIARVSDTHVKRLSRHQVEVGDILFSRRGDVARFAIAREREVGWLCGTGCMRVRLNDPNTDVDFLVHFLQQEAVRKWLVQQAKGITMPNLNTTILRALPLMHPSLAEQKRIAAVLDKADDLRGKRRQALATLDTLLQSVFLDMFGDPVTNPRAWPKMTFEDVAPSRLGKMLDAKQQTGDHGRPYLRNISVQWDRFDLSDVQTMDFDDADREEFLLKSGDLMICEGGEPGRCAIWRDELSECYFQKALHRARPRLTKATPEYLLFMMRALADRGGFKDHVTVATIAHLTGEKLKRMLVPVPPVALQRKFTDMYAKVRARRTALASAAAATDGLFASLQSAAFTGTLFADSGTSYGAAAKHPRARVATA